jgi:hypothetical protein
VRSVITGLNSDGRSTVIHDGPPREWVGAKPSQTMTASAITAPGGMPAEGAVAVGLSFPIEGMRMPKATEVGHGTAPPVTGAIRCNIVAFGPNLLTPMHADRVISVGVVTSGAVRLVLEEGAVWLEAGDTAVLPGTMHAWQTDARGGILAFSAVPLP